MKYIVKAVEGDMFWSSGLSPQCVSTIKPEYSPGANQIGNILDAIRFDLVREAVLFEDRELLCTPIPHHRQYLNVSHQEGNSS